ALPRALDEAARYDRKILVERAVSGREIEVSVLGNNEPVASLPGEVTYTGEFYDYATKYADGQARLTVPAPLPAEPTRRIRALGCAWIGSRTGVEARRAPERDIAYFAIPTGKLRRYWAWQNVVDLGVSVPAGVASARRLLGRLRPRVVFATGGFVALPVVLAAATLRLPIVIHEQTTAPGLANRIGARFARRIA